MLTRFADKTRHNFGLTQSTEAPLLAPAKTNTDAPLRPRRRSANYVIPHCSRALHYCTRIAVLTHVNNCFSRRPKYTPNIIMLFGNPIAEDAENAYATTCLMVVYDVACQVPHYCPWWKCTALTGFVIFSTL